MFSLSFTKANTDRRIIMVNSLNVINTRWQITDFVLFCGEI